MYTIKVTVSNDQTLKVGHFVRVRATIGDPHVRLFLRLIDTPLPIVLGYTFLHQFNPLINWKHRTVQISLKGTTHIIPVVNAYGNPHTPMSVDSADGANTEVAPTTAAASHGVECFIGELAE